MQNDTDQRTPVEALSIITGDAVVEAAPQYNITLPLSLGGSGAVLLAGLIMLIVIRRRYRELMSDPLAYAKRRVWVGT
jgi:hypothetical protein